MYVGFIDEVFTAKAFLGWEKVFNLLLGSETLSLRFNIPNVFLLWRQ